VLLTPQLLKMRDHCLAAGIRETEFWNMTIGEASRAIGAYIEQKRERAYFDYTEAMTIGLFVSSMFSSKSPPKIEEIYPELFDEEAGLEQAEQQIRDERSAANFIKFANSFNQRYKPNGDGKSESENNG